MKVRLSRHRSTFREVMENSDDQVTVRELIHELMPDDIKAEIVCRFNARVDERNAYIAQEVARGEVEVEQ
jgi:hypothetical protein